MSLHIKIAVIGCIILGISTQAFSADEAVQASCDVASVNKIDHHGLTEADAVDICKVIERRMGKSPTIRFTRQMYKMMFGFAYLGYRDNPARVTADVMDLISARGQLGKSDDVRMRTMDVLVKSYQGTDKTVLPKDFARALRAMPSAQATGAGDDFMYTLAAVLQDEKSGKH